MRRISVELSLKALDKEEEPGKSSASPISTSETQLLSPGSSVAGQIFQIGTGKETRVITLAQEIRDLASDSGLPIPNLTFERMRKGEVRRNYSGISKARKLLGFQAKTSLETGLKKLWQASEEK